LPQLRLSAVGGFSPLLLQLGGESLFGGDVGELGLERSDLRLHTAGLVVQFALAPVGGLLLSERFGLVTR
jgi:hypothetical protein